MSTSRKQILDALSKAREKSKKRDFNQSVELIINLREVDMKRPENRVNLRVELPKGVGKRSVLIFASGDLALRARRAGVDGVIEPLELEALSKDRKEVKKRLKEYEVFISEAPLMPTVSRVVGPFLGPKGKMPVPVPPQAPIDEILEREKKVVVLRSRDKPLIQCLVGVESMEDEEIAENIESVLSNLTRTLKRGAGNIKSVYIKLTMGEAVKLI
ncbi:50S ribosomal protein L1 [Candidatus Bathyarchaeota archaeon]|nr:50S ribosomal protein L1 [Candidatus Bathyarchaeota archaeon]MBS7630070.1 50S ribosomal protein L1 [Candidatus Bathyarchaeota archaeon]